MPHRLAIIVLCLAVVLVGPAATAQADITTKLPFPNGNAVSIVVDPSGRHVFVSGGPGTSSVVVLDYSGKIVKTITGQGGAAGMALDTATHTLYVALHDQTAISEINTQSLAETTRFSTAPNADPSSIVIAGGKLWFACFKSDETGCLVTANLDGTGMAAPSGISGFSYFATLLAAGGTNNHLLALADRVGEPPEVAVYDVSGATPTLVSSVNGLNGGSGGLVDEMTFDPTGANLLVAQAAPPYIQSLATSTLLPSGQYPTGPYPDAVAITANGKFVAGGISNGNAADDVFVYPVGSTTPVRTWNIGTSPTGSNLPADSLAFSPDGSLLFAVTEDAATGHLAFHVLTRPTIRLTETSTSLGRSAAKVRYGSRVKLKVHVRGARRGKVALFATIGGIEKHVATRTLRSGRVTFRVRPKQNTTYSAQLAQGLSYSSSTSKSVTVSVRPALSVSTRPGGKVRVQGHVLLRTWVTGKVRPRLASFEQLEFIVQRHASGGWYTAATNEFPIGNGTVRAFFLTTKKGLCRVRVVYSGDDAFLAGKSSWKIFSAR